MFGIVWLTENVYNSDDNLFINVFKQRLITCVTRLAYRNNTIKKS